VGKYCLYLIIITVNSVIHADYVIQTDWSGGYGYWGPVLDWSNEFYLDTGVEWNESPDELVLLGNHLIAGNLSGASSVYSNDIDGDGDFDVLCATVVDSKIRWWENEDGSGSSWTPHLVDDEFEGAVYACAQDIDGDGDMDVLGAALIGDEIAWWANQDGSGFFWTKHSVDSDYYGAQFVHAEDMDGDSDYDILGAARNDDEITWWENSDGSGESWIEHIVAVNYGSARCVYSADVNGDGYMDVMGASWDQDDITWWENVLGTGTFWIEHIVDADFNNPTHVFAEDIDGDGDIDILGAARWDHDITWWENQDGSGINWIEHTIAGDFAGANCVFSIDMDNDGDMDVLGSATDDDCIAWWENSDGSGTTWITHIVDWHFQSASHVHSADINGDGNPDILGTSYINQDDDLVWWDPLGHTPGSLMSSVIDTEDYPYWDYLDWDAETPVGTSVSVTASASDDWRFMGSWSDTLTVPTSLEGILTDGQRYVQYAVILDTSDFELTPVLDEILISWNPVGIEDGDSLVTPELLSFSPNPASTPGVRFSLPEAASVELSIFDLSGRLFDVLKDEYSSGYSSILLDDLSPGIYFCRMISGDFTAIGRFVVIE